MRRTPVVVALAAAAVAVAVAGAVVPVPARAAVPVLVLDGRGFGHGVGMAQDGALSMGQAGASYQQILGQFYPGTAIGRKAGFVRVPVLVAPSRTATVTFPDGGQVRDTLGDDQSPGFPIDVAPGGRARVWFDGRYHVEVTGARARAAAAGTPSPLSPLSASSPPQDAGNWPKARVVAAAAAGQESPSTTAPPSGPTIPGVTSPPTSAPPATTTPGGDAGTTTTSPAPASTTAPPSPAPTVTASSSRPLLSVPATGGTVLVDARGRRYRGFLEANAAQGPLRLVNQVDVEQYLRGMGEVRNPKWPLASLRTQAIAARTYALRAMASVGEICEDQRCQVYLGAQAEYAAMDRAVRETQGQVLTYRGGLASTVYSANGGGFEASPAEGFGTGSTDYPYLRAAPYPSRDPHPWTVKVGLADLARRMGYRGTVTGVRISASGPSGRATKVALDGTGGTREIEGVRFDAALGLKSTLFTVRIEQADSAPTPPPPEELIQALPDQLQTAPPPDTPLSELGIELKSTTTTREPRKREAALTATAPAPDDSPWRALAIFALIAAAASSAVIYGIRRAPTR